MHKCANAIKRDFMCNYPPKSPDLWPSPTSQCRLCLVKDMKTLCTSVNYSAGMSAEPPQCVEQLMVRLAWPCVSSGCLVGGGTGPAGVNSQSWLAQLLPCTVMVSCRVITARPLRYPSRVLQSGVPYLCHPLSPYIPPCVHCTLWGNTHIHAGMMQPFDWLFVDVTRFSAKVVNAIHPCGLQAMFLYMKFMPVDLEVSMAASHVGSTVSQMSLYNTERAMCKRASATSPIYRRFLFVSTGGTLIKTENLYWPARDNFHRWV